jgi:hypothetical protein
MGSGYQVVQNGVANMSVNVGIGIALVPGTEGTTQGSYIVVNSAVENLAIAAAHATLARIDRVGIRVRDQAYSGADNDGANIVVTGTPSGSPSAPAEPNNFLTLALVSIPAADTTITSNQITDMRIGLAGPGGVIYCTSANRPSSSTVSSGQEVFETDTGLYRRWDSANWLPSRSWRARTTLGGSAGEINMTGIPSTLRTLEVKWACRSTGAALAENMLMRVNNTASGHGYTQLIQQNVTANPSLNSQGASHFPVGIITGATAPAGYVGSGHCRIANWDQSSLRPHFVWQSGSYTTTAANTYNEIGQGTYANAGPYTQLRFILLSGNSFAAGSFVELEGWE